MHSDFVFVALSVNFSSYLFCHFFSYNENVREVNCEASQRL